MSKLVLIFTRPFEAVHLKKDVGLFPLYLKRYFDEVEIVYFSLSKIENEIPETYKGLKLLKLGKIKDFYTRGYRQYFQRNKIKKLLIKHIRDDSKITHIMFFHWSYTKLYYVNAIKSVYPKIKIYLKMDCDIPFAEQVANKWAIRHFGIKGLLHNATLFNGMRNLSLITAETEAVCNVLRKNNLFSEKTFSALNGYDDDLYQKTSPGDKEKIMITVGRLGTNQKNTELLLEIIKRLDLADWKFHLIGSIEEEFKSVIEQFYILRPDLKEKVIFTDAITDSKKLMNEYKKSSIFVLTSRYESSALVLTEAAINGCYICSTDVGAIREISSQNQYCWISPDSKTGEQNIDSIKEHFSKKLQELINNPASVYNNYEERCEYYKTHFLMSKIVDSEFFTNYSVVD